MKRHDTRDEKLSDTPAWRWVVYLLLFSGVVAFLGHKFDRRFLVGIPVMEGVLFLWFWLMTKPFARKKPEDGPQVLVFLNPLCTLFAGAEKQKGSPLTREEVIAIRDGAKCVKMSASQAHKFYASLDSQIPIPRIDPEQCWEQWQELRTTLDAQQ